MDTFWGIVAVLAFAVLVTIAASSLMRVSGSAMLVGLAGLLGLLALGTVALFGAVSWMGRPAPRGRSNRR